MNADASSVRASRRGRRTVATCGGKGLVIHGDAYVAALRDWVTNGDGIRYAMSDEEFARRVTPRSAAEMEAEAAFKLAVVSATRRRDRATRLRARGTVESGRLELSPPGLGFERMPAANGSKSFRKPTRSITRSTSSPTRRKRADKPDTARDPGETGERIRCSSDKARTNRSGSANEKDSNYDLSGSVKSKEIVAQHDAASEAN